MTANQIEYWKLQETRRHNVVTESMDKPVKESQAAYNYASIDLMREQAATQETVRAMNLASAAASYASAENQYAQAQLNYERQNTEVLQQQYVSEQARNMNLRNDYQEMVNFFAPTLLGSESAVASYTRQRAEDMSWAWNNSDRTLASWSVLTDATGLRAGDITNAGVKVFSTIYSN